MYIYIYLSPKHKVKARTSRFETRLRLQRLGHYSFCRTLWDKHTVPVCVSLVSIWRQKYVKQSLSAGFKHVPSWPDKHEYADFIPSSNIHNFTNNCPENLQHSQKTWQTSHRPQGQGFSCWFQESGADGNSKITNPDQYQIQLLLPSHTPGSAGTNLVCCCHTVLKLTKMASCSRSQCHTLRRRALPFRVSTHSETHSYTLKISIHLLLIVTESGGGASPSYL